MKILITYQFFSPAFKAGGPIQSLCNLVDFLSKKKNLDIYIFCSNKDLGNTLLNVVVNQWVCYKTNVKVLYNTNEAKRHVFEIIENIRPDIIYINGVYSLPYSIYPLLVNLDCKKILAVRGMLHPGALSQKMIKKKVFLTFLKIFGAFRKCEYHATSIDEKKYIENQFGNRVKVTVIPNFANDIVSAPPIKKNVGTVRLVSICLISPMKNILFVLNALKDTANEVVYDIYGPIKDEFYWNSCIDIISKLPKNVIVNYKGAIEPKEVKSVLTNYHYFILPSVSENFGHAIFEALSAGRPVITSKATPWNNLEVGYAGFNIEVNTYHGISDVINVIAHQTNEDYLLFANGARKYIERFKSTWSDTESKYNSMFDLVLSDV